jgi:hypothetical protein
MRERMNRIWYYRHINRLAEGGVLEVVDERPIRGTVERVYAVAETGGASLSTADLEQATRVDHVGTSRSFSRRC